eukprot:1738467-Rhodomonas_salina.2
MASRTLMSSSVLTSGCACARTATPHLRVRRAPAKSCRAKRSSLVAGSGGYLVDHRDLEREPGAEHLELLQILGLLPVGCTPTVCQQEPNQGFLKPCRHAIHFGSGALTA